MKYPRYDIYEKLYEKYFDPESLKVLMDLAGDMKNKIGIDVCCGTGICTEEALKRKAHHITMIDEESDMIPQKFKYQKQIEIWDNPVHIALLRMNKNYNFYDFAVCRQAVNYWIDENIIRLLVHCLRPGGIFVFNTFNTKPDPTPKIKQYHHRGTSFTEMSYITPDDIVHHVQVREGYPPHIAEYKWIPYEKFREILLPHFSIERLTRNKIDYYKCIKNRRIK